MAAVAFAEAVMRSLPAFLLFVLFQTSALAAADSPFLAAAEQLDGTWASDDYALRVDSDRAQANVDGQRPFQWQRFLVKQVAGAKVTFTIGAELFEATLETDALKLTSTSFRGERILQKQEATAGTQ